MTNKLHNKVVNFVLLSTLWVAAYPLLAQSESEEQVCADVITYGQNPQTGEWQTFPTPCQVPKGWQSSPVKPNPNPSPRANGAVSTDPQVCAQVITYGKNPQTGEWVEFQRPCDVPKDWQSSPTKPDTGTSATPSGSTTTPSDKTSSTSGSTDNCAKEVVTYAQHPTSKKWYIFTNPCEVPTGWTNSQDEKVCAGIIIYGQSPKTGKWYPFATPCDKPETWELSLLKPTKDGTPPADAPLCSGAIEYAQNPKTTNAYRFMSACDIPEGWDRLAEKPFKLMPEGDVDCPPVITYAQHPEKKTWYAFSTACDVPEGWLKSAIPSKPTSGEDCSSFKVTYSQQAGKVSIPLIFLKSSDTQPAFKGVELEMISSPLFTPYLFFLSHGPEPVVKNTQP